MSAMEQANDVTTEPETPSQDDASARGEGTRVLGLTRWVQYVFVVAAAFLFWFLDKAVTLIWQNFAEPNSTAISVVSAVVAAIVVQRLYRNDRVHSVAAEIVGELAKVSWPSGKETRVATIVVIITSLIAAAIVGAFDFVWSAITDLLYKYKV
jgi:preprotein translocase subunit SecE